MKAFRKQLTALSLDPKDSFAQQIRMLAGSHEAALYEAPLRQMILAMPEMVLQIRQGLLDTAQPWRIRRLHNFVLAYLYNPTDLLPEKTEGLFGYLDDAYLVALVYETAMRERLVRDDGYDA